jgi:hypothetical protein
MGTRARRKQLITETVSQIQQIRDLLECVWPAASDTARRPLTHSPAGPGVDMAV